MTIKKNSTLRAAVSVVAFAGLLASLTACNDSGTKTMPLSPETSLTNSAVSTNTETDSAVSTNTETDSAVSTNTETDNTTSTNTKTDNTTSTNTKTDSTVSTNNDEENVSFQTPSDSSTANKRVYDGVFKGVDGNSSTGAPMSYDEVMEMITSPFQKENGIFLDSFYIVETVRALPYDEARNVNGWSEVCEGKTMYEVKLLKDLISGEVVDRTEKIIVASGTVEWQKDGDPAYAPGERFTVALTKPQENCDYLQTPISIMFRYDVVEDATGTTLYSRKSEIDKLNLPAAMNIDEETITSTTQNPAVHSQKVGLDTLADFLRSDWEQRGVSSHFEKEVSE